MNSLLSTFASESWAQVIQALLHTTWSGFLISCLLYGMLRRVIQPSLRYYLCLSALGGVVVSGLLAWAVLSSRSQAPLKAEIHTNIEIVQPAPVGFPSATPHSEVGNASPVAIKRGEWMGWLGLCWITGVGAMLVRSVGQVIRAEHIRRTAVPLCEPEFLKQLARVQEKLKIVRRLQVRATDQLTSPAVIGFLSATLLFPASLLAALSSTQLEMILLHELAHVRRGDYLVNLLQLLVESVFYFNPAVWWISRQIRQEREACCDATAVQNASSRAEYARVLAMIAQAGIVQTPLAAIAAVPRTGCAIGFSDS